MEAKKCDRCKKFYTIESEKSKSSSFVLYPFNGIPARPDVYEIVLAKGDLCAECTMAFMRWLKNEDNNNDVSTSEIEAVIATAVKAHKEMCSSEYDYGFQYGLEHSLYLLKRVIENKEENKMFDETAQTTEAFNVGLKTGREEKRKKYIEAMRTMSAKITELEGKSEIKGMKELIENIVDKVNELSKTVIRLRDYDEASNQIVQLSGDVIALQSWYAGTDEGVHERCIAEVVKDILSRKDEPKCKEIRKNCVMLNIVAEGTDEPYYMIEYYDKRDNTYYQGFGSKNYKTVKAYQKAYFDHWDRGFYEKQIEELEDKHWEECRQIALYDDELKQLKKEITEKYVKRGEMWAKTCGYKE